MEHKRSRLVENTEHDQRDGGPFGPLTIQEDAEDIAEESE